ncbi:MAG: hypothetical protein ACYTFY_11105 [Planctomycetota bacterium]|jgi:hypothetical protein
MKKNQIISIGIGITIFVILYITVIQSWIQSGNFDRKSMKKFGSHKSPISMNDPLVKDSKELYRTGKALIVVPEKKISRPNETKIIDASIHSAWHKLGMSVRAGSPEDVDTLIRVYIPKGKGRTYQKRGGIQTKYVSAKPITIHIFDWKAKTYIGDHVFDPGKFKGDTLTQEEIDKMLDARHPSTIAEFINNLPVK